MNLSRFTLVLVLLLTACAAGPTPERVGFDYPGAGFRFTPRRNVVSETTKGQEAPVNTGNYTLIFPRTRSEIEGPYRRLLISGVEGEQHITTSPLYDELSLNFYGADRTYNFEFSEERDIPVEWNGVMTKSGTLRVFHMTPVDESGEEQYTFAITVFHYGNTIEVCWRDGRITYPDDERYEEFWHWTHGLKFYEPEVPEP